MGWLKEKPPDKGLASVLIHIVHEDVRSLTDTPMAMTLRSVGKLNPETDNGQEHHHRNLADTLILPVATLRGCADRSR